MGQLSRSSLPRPLAVSWIGFAVYAVVANAVSWSIVDGLIVPNRLWLVMIFWVAPAVAGVGEGANFLEMVNGCRPKARRCPGLTPLTLTPRPIY